MMSEKTENRIATFVAIIIGLLMAVGVNAQTTISGDVSYDNNGFTNLVNNKDVIFEGNVVITGGQNISLNNSCVTFKGTFTKVNNGQTLTINRNNVDVYLAQQTRADLQSEGFRMGVANGSNSIIENATTGCGGVSLPVEAIDFYYQDKGDGEGSFNLVVTDEYDIEQYRILITDQNGIDIGYKWWYASETQEGLYRVYEIPVTLPTDCADIEVMYAKVYKMESSTMEYEQLLNTISILNK
jgi:hypothetical protein